jgi:DNA polymerase III epsilon subunit family exonuclease
MQRSLAELRARGESLSLGDLARELFALAGPVEASLARRLLAAALGRAEADLPEILRPRQLRPLPEQAVAGLHLARAEFSVVDLETTGFSAERCAILEIGAVRIRGLEIAEAFETLVRPAAAIPPRIAALTGIEAALVAGAPRAGPALRAFRRWLDRAPRAPLVAHNAAFDAPFVGRALERQGLARFAAPVLCTRRLARRILPRLGRYDLDSVCAHFGIANGARHRASGDARAAARVLLELLALARAGFGVETVGDLLDLQQQRPQRP